MSKHPMKIDIFVTFYEEAFQNPVKVIKISRDS